MLTSDDGRVGRAPSSSVRVVCCVHDMKTSLRMPVTLCAKRRRRRRDPETMKTLDTRSASSLYFIAAETPLFLTSMNAPWIFLFVAACVEI